MLFVPHGNLPETLPVMLRVQIEAAIASKGGGLVWADDSTWPFGEMTWSEVTVLWQQSGLSGPEFIQQNFRAGTSSVEVGPPS